MIDKFVGEYRFLSNFYIEPDYSHVEGEYQREKATSQDDRDRFNGLNPYAAKELGNTIRKRPDWDAVKYDIMHKLVRQKFLDSLELCNALLATGSQDLVEGNKHHDNTWGNCICDGCTYEVGKNWLGEILMDVRSEIRGRDSRRCRSRRTSAANAK